MEAICKFNKYGHCRYGEFCNFYHEDKRCQKEVCDHKACNFRHPKKCRNIATGKKCKFEDSCDFDHGDDQRSNADEEVKTWKAKVESLERIIETKDKEIGDLRKVLDDTGISQFNGIDDDVISVTTVENESDADSEESSETLNYCELCDFKTHNCKGLKIHMGKSHKNKCKRCGQIFPDVDSLNRHEKAEMILDHADPLESPDKLQNLGLNKNGEPFIEVMTVPDTPIARLYFEDCPEQDEHDVLHLAISTVVLGELSEPGCFVDWDSLSTLLKENGKEQLS